MRLAALSFALVFAAGIFAAAPRPAACNDAKVDFAASFAPDRSRIGEVSAIEVRASVPSGYYIYSMTKIEGGPMRLEIDVQGDSMEPVGEWHAIAPEVVFDQGFKKPVEHYKGEVIHRRAFRLNAAHAGQVSVRIAAKGQICNDRQCIPFRNKLTALLTVEQGQARPNRAAAPLLEGEAFPPDRPAPVLESQKTADGLPLGKGLLSFLLIAFLAGLGALVTPCVFPMIPITVSFFSKFQKISVRRSLIMATIYAASIVVMFTLVGVAVSLVFGAVGMQVLSASVGFNIFLTALLIFFSLNLFGLFEINAPNWLINRTSNKERQWSGLERSFIGQTAGVFFMAVTFVLVSFTCTVGFVGIVLTEAAKGNWFYPAIGMLLFSTAFSLPFFMLAALPSMADKLKGKGGDWMVAVKVVLGFLELASAFKFLSNVDLVLGWELVTRPLVLAIWVAIFFGAGLYLFRVYRMPADDKTARGVGPVRAFFAICMFAMSAYSATGIKGEKSMGGWIDGWLPPSHYPVAGSDKTGQEGRLDWIVDNIEKGMKKAAEENKPLFVDFTGYTCTNCRFMEESIFPKNGVVDRLEQMVRVTAYTDGNKEVHEKQREYQIKRFSTAALPFYAIIDPFDDEVLASFASMTNDAREFAAFLDRGLAAFKRSAPGIEIATDGTPVDFEFPLLADTGKRFKLSSLRGSWVLVNFWASWCAPCKKELEKEFPEALAAALHVKLVTVAFDGDETRDAALGFANKAGLTKSVALIGGEDIEEASLDKAFEASKGVPLTYLIHPKGHIAWRQQGSVSKALLDRLLEKTR